jgi:membrane glycosyltransferase
VSTRHDTALDRAASPIVPVGHDWHTAALWRRGLMGFLVLVQTFAATYAMVGVLPYHGANSLEATILAVFALLFAWISVGFWMAVYGFMARRMGGDTYAPSARFAGATAADGELARTAIVFPIYHEEVERAFAGVRSTYTDLKRTGASDHFELFVLSDSRDPDIWLQEQEAWYRVCDALDAHGRIHYRRRVVNLNRKTGNLGDFLRRWGRRFRYMVVMDADSLMSGETMVRMVRLMEAAPEIGILQTSPSIVNAASAHARIQQFANRLYGPLFTTGLAAVQLGDAVYWGHNACDSRGTVHAPLRAAAAARARLPERNGAQS